MTFSLLLVVEVDRQTLLGEAVFIVSWWRYQRLPITDSRLGGIGNGRAR